MTDTQNLINLFPNNVIDIPDFEANVAQLNRPSLEPGTYLAVATGGELKINDTSGAVGFMVSFIINTDPKSIEVGWNGAANVQLVRKYFFVGRIVNGKLTETEKAGFATRALQAFGLGGKFNPATDFGGKQVILDIIHEPAYNDPARLYLGVKSVKPYTLNGGVAPLLANVSDYIENKEPTEISPVQSSRAAF